jgi:thiamine-monophosphate kinase
MQLSKIGEFGLIKSLQKKCVVHRSEILTGIGDDTPVIRVADKKLLVTSDMMLEGVHFDLSLTTFSQLGHKLLAINLSDIFAMGESRNISSSVSEFQPGILPVRFMNCIKESQN